MPCGCSNASYVRHWISVTSPPIVSNGVVVTPVYVVAKEAPPGWVKGIDAITGELKWVFRSARQAPEGDVVADVAHPCHYWLSTALRTLSRRSSPSARGLAR